MTSRPAATTGVRAREMNLYRPYFDMVAAGRKTIEIRVEYPNLRNLQAGDHIRFICGRDDARTQVKRVARYTSFEEMLDAEGADGSTPTAPVTSSLPTSAASTDPRKKHLASWPSRSNSSIRTLQQWTRPSLP
jgi:ASC-1-like (ASCH) protein